METKRKEYPAEWYDKIYHQDKINKTRYFLPPEKSAYCSIWNKAIQWIQDVPEPSLFDLGCGTGQFMDLASRSGIQVVGGMDFSAEGVRISQERMPGHAHLISCQDLNIRPYEWLRPAKIMTLFEVLEHIRDDLGVLSALPASQQVIFSVPNFKCENHVRIFPVKEELVERYGERLIITDVIQFRKVHIIWLVRGVTR